MSPRSRSCARTLTLTAACVPGRMRFRSAMYRSQVSRARRSSCSSSTTETSGTSGSSYSASSRSRSSPAHSTRASWPIRGKLPPNIPTPKTTRMKPNRFFQRPRAFLRHSAARPASHPPTQGAAVSLPVSLSTPHQQRGSMSSETDWRAQGWTARDGEPARLVPVTGSRFGPACADP